jgi:hypothetical protein
MMRQLRTLQEQAAHLSALAGTLSRSAPDRAEGADATGSVTVALDRAGRPVEIRVGNGWAERIEPSRLAAGIGEAHADAVRKGMRAWSESLKDSRWHAQRDGFDSGEGPAEPDTQPPPPAGERREVSDLAEEVISSLRSVQQVPVPEPAAVDGSDDDERVTVRLGPGGLVSCSIDQQWATGRSGDSITAALTSALGRARAKLPSEDKAAAGIDGLIGDVLATLASFNDR